MNLLEINVFILWFQSEFWNDFVAMKLLFSRINEERKCTISLQQGSVCLAGKREGVHFVPNPFDWGQKWDLWSDLQWIPHWTHLFGAFGRLWMRGPSCRELKISKWQSPFSDKFMFLLDWMFFRMKVVTICLTKCCNLTSIVWWQIIWPECTGKVKEWWNECSLCNASSRGDGALRESLYTGWLGMFSEDKFEFSFTWFLDIFYKSFGVSWFPEMIFDGFIRILCCFLVCVSTCYDQIIAGKLVQNYKQLWL